MSQPPVVLVTGAAGGIGHEIVRVLLEELSACVVATDIARGDLDKLKEAHQERLIIEIGDICNASTSESCVEKAISAFGRLTGVCLNAGVFGPCHRISEAVVDKWDTAFHVNVLSHLLTLRYALPELRKSKGRVTATTSGAGQAPLFSGWGFYGMSKSAVGFLIRQLHLEEPDIIAVGISPGLCDTQMVRNLMTGGYEGWGSNDVAKYEKFVAGIELISPAVAGNVYAQAVTKADSSISGLVLDYDDPHLPIEEHLKRKEQPIDYTKHSTETNGA